MFLLIGSVGKESACNTGDVGDRSSMSGLVGYSPWGYKELNMTEVTKYINTQIYVFIIYTHLY